MTGAASDDAAIVRFMLVQAGVRDDSPAAQAFDRIVGKALRYEWVLPLVSGEETPEANDRTLKIAAEILRGRSGEDALVAAMRA